MDQIYIPILAAFVGGLTATVASLGAVWLQGKAQAQRERMKLVMEIATADYKERKQMMMHAGGGAMPPIVTFLHYHVELQKILDSRELTPEDILDLRRRNEAITEALRSLDARGKSE